MRAAYGDAPVNGAFYREGGLSCSGMNGREHGLQIGQRRRAIMSRRG
jgi:hypothetical protein